MKKRTVLILTLFVSATVAWGFSGRAVQPASAQSGPSLTELRQQAQSLQETIKNNQKKLAELAEQVVDLKSKLTSLQVEIDQANYEIQLSTLRIAELQDSLIKAQAELDRQKILLKESVRELYKRTGASTVELLLSSDNFTDFFNDQVYLEKLRAAVETSTKKVIALKQQIQDEEAKEQEVLKQRKIVQGVLDARKAEQASILAQTQGDEAKYAEIVASDKKQLQDAEAQIKKLTTRPVLVSQGAIKAGQQVGFMGSTGFSTGPHLHFMVTTGGATVDPQQFLGGSFGWPVGGESGPGNISQSFGCVAPPYYYLTQCSNGNSLHNGLDIAGWYGAPIIAAADGDIVFRGCVAGYGYMVILDHRNGYQTSYPHMITPSGQSVGYCNE